MQRIQFDIDALLPIHWFSTEIFDNMKFILAYKPGRPQSCWPWNFSYLKTESPNIRQKPQIWHFTFMFGFGGLPNTIYTLMGMGEIAITNGLQK